MTDRYVLIGTPEIKVPKTVTDEQLALIVSKVEKDANQKLFDELDRVVLDGIL